ncbi:MAG TPA: iron-sulfur cluster assembly protein, partial [Thermoplasmata archaeon]
MKREDQLRLAEEAVRVLSSVTDPELDEPITDLGFVKNVSVEDGSISVDIVTSTFWCSPNFVYMMLQDARDAISRVPGVRTVRVHLEGHHDAAKINEAINLGKSFSECYGPEAEGDIAELNKRFREKALRSRLYGMATTLAKYGVTRDELISLKLDDVKLEGSKVLVRSGGRTLEVADPSDAGRIARYVSFLEKLGLRDG